MADSFSPTVLQQPIPVADMMPLERLLLSRIFDADANGKALYFHAAFGPRDVIAIAADELRTAFEASAAAGTSISIVAGPLAAASPEDAEIAIDVSGTSWEFIVQDIVRRSPTLPYVTAVTAFTCSKMRPDGFGGMAVLITADRIAGTSTTDILEEFLAALESGSGGEAHAMGGPADATDR